MQLSQESWRKHSGTDSRSEYGGLQKTISTGLSINEVYLHSYSSDFQRIVDSFRTIPSN